MSASMRLKLAPEGPEVSRLAYGVWRLLEDPQGAERARVLAKVQACLELGITTFDHADIYGGYRCEEAFGEVLGAEPGLRHKMELVTKCGIMLVDPARPANRLKHYDYSREHIVSSVDRSLSNLRTDYVDVLLLHRPSPLLDPDEVAEALQQVVQQGKVRYVGVSNFSPAQLDTLASRLTLPLVTHQVEVNPLHLQPFLDGTLDQCLQRRIAPMAWSPLAGGRLFEGRGEAEARVRVVLSSLQARYEADMDQLVYAWLLKHPSRMVPVIGTHRLERIAAAARSLSIDMELQDWFAVWSASTGAEVP